MSFLWLGFRQRLDNALNEAKAPLNGGAFITEMPGCTAFQNVCLQLCRVPVSI